MTRDVATVWLSSTPCAWPRPSPTDRGWSIAPIRSIRHVEVQCRRILAIVRGRNLAYYLMSTRPSPRLVEPASTTQSDDLEDRACRIPAVIFLADCSQLGSQTGGKIVLGRAETAPPFVADQYRETVYLPSGVVIRLRKSGAVYMIESRQSPHLRPTMRRSHWISGCRQYRGSRESAQARMIRLARLSRNALQDHSRRRKK